ncbi:MAG: Stp1/IreP family PP2C-type Ser/Thr phosphatase [bacterium]
MASFTIKYAGGTDQGLVRKDNQDCFGKFPEDDDDLDAPGGQLFIVADGMGGHMGGQEASKLAVTTIRKCYFSERANEIPKRLEKAFIEANQNIHRHAENHPHLYGMGTTCTALAFSATQVYVAHVGDSRAYLINKTKMQKLTEDHSQVAEMQRQGLLTEEEAQLHPHRSILTRALGILPEVEVDIQDDISLKAGDSFLLCTDGLAKVARATLKDIVLSKEPKEACKRLIKLANDAGGDDNVTVQIVSVRSGEKRKGKLRFWS